MKAFMSRRESTDRIRVLRIAHASLTPALRERERALAAECPDIDLQVVTTRQWHEAGVDVKVTGDDLFPVLPARSLLSRHIQLFAYDPLPLIAALRHHRPHLIDLNHEPYSVACAEVLALRDWFAPKTPVIMQVAQNIMRSYPAPFNWLQKRALREVSAAYVCSESTKQVLREKGFTNPITLIPFGVNTQIFTEKPDDSPRPDVLTIGFVGRMLPGKGLNVLANALAQIADAQWKLLLVGDGPGRGALADALARNNLLARAEFAGAVPYDRVAEFYRRMDFLAMPTRTTRTIREQFGRVLVEAMASGVPVIGTTCGAIPEVIADAGLIVPENNADALANALRRMLSDAALRQRCAKLGRTRVEECYAWNIVARKTHQLLKHVLSGHVAPMVTRPAEVTA